jgi:hypothetical protein
LQGIDGHFGPELRRFVLMHYHQGQSTLPRLATFLPSIGMAIAKRQFQRLLDFYVSLKAYRLKPGRRRVAALRTQFDRILLRRTCFVTLDRLLKRLHANKAELLMVLDRPQTPLHTNGSENDIRCYATRRKVSARTRSDDGRDCRDAFLSLAKTCDKLGIAVWDYLGSRLMVAGNIIIQPLDRYVRARFRPA